MIQDRIVFSGANQEIVAGASDLLRECQRSGGEGLVVYRRHPAPDLDFTSGDAFVVQELRLMASVLRVCLVDYLVFNTWECLSARIGQNWVD